MMLRTAFPLAIVLVAGSASAAPRPRGVGVRLDYQRGPRTHQCPDDLDFRAEVAARLGHDPFTGAGPWRLIAIMNRRRDGAFILTAELFDDHGASARSLEPMIGRDCPYLVKTVLATRIAVELADAPLVPAPPPPPTPPPVVAPPAPDVAPAPIFPNVLLVRAGPTVVFGAAPRTAVGVSGDLGFYRLTASLPFDGFSFAMGFRWDPQAAGHVPGEAESARINTSRLLGTVALCAHWWKLYGCGVVEAGRLWTEGQGIALPSREDIPIYAATGTRLGVEVPFAPHLRFRVFGEVLGILTPVEIPVDERPVWTAPRVAGGVGAGLSFYL